MLYVPPEETVSAVDRYRMDAERRRREGLDGSQPMGEYLRGVLSALRPRVWVGPPGPQAGRIAFPMRLPLHRESVAQMRGMYPFLAESGPPAVGMLIGQERFTRSPFCFDPFRLYELGLLSNPSVFVAGVIGSGKSALAKTLLARAAAYGYRFAVPGDIRGEYEPLCRLVGIEPIRLGPGGAPLNVLAAPPPADGMSRGQWWDVVRAHWETLLSSVIRAARPGQRELSEVEETALELALDQMTRTGSGEGPDRPAPASLPRLMDALFDPDELSASELRMSRERLREETRDIALTVRRLVRGSLRGLIAGEGVNPFDTAAPGVVVDVSRVRSSDAAMALALACIQSMMEVQVSLDRQRRFVIYDELWRLIRYPALVGRISAGIKLTRDTGTAHTLLTHRITDLIGTSREAEQLALGLLADCSTRIVYRQTADQLDTTAAALDLTSVEADLLPLLDQGTGLWKINTTSYLVDHLVPRDGLEWSVINTDAAMTDAYRIVDDPGAEMATFLAEEPVA